MASISLSQLDENQIADKVTNYLQEIIPIFTKKYRLISIDENFSTSDLKTSRILPIYFQFKASHAINPSEINFSEYDDNTPLDNIVNYRSINHLSDNPTLFFKLNEREKTSHDFQNNILYNLNRPIKKPVQFAFYVAPLIQSTTEYEKLLINRGYKDLFRTDELGLINGETEKSLSLSTNFFLKEHISFPAHKFVTTSAHHYSFLKNATNISWDWKAFLYDDFRFSSQLSLILTSLDNQLLFSRVNDYVKYLRKSNYYNDRFGRKIFNNYRDSISIFKEFGIHLKKEYNINLMIITK